MNVRSYSRPFFKKSKLSVFLLNCLKFIFITYQGNGYRNILKLSCRPLGFDSYKNFKIISKRRSGNILLASISTEKYFGEKFLLFYHISWLGFVAHNLGWVIEGAPGFYLGWCGAGVWGDWALGYNFMKFMIMRLQLFNDVWGNLHVLCLLVIITLCFACGEKEIL